MPKVLDIARKSTPKLVTWGLVIVAAISAFLLYHHWTSAPWTRDGQVRANIVKIAPQVNGYLVTVAVHDNQLVHQGDLLFEVDPSSYRLAVDKAKVALEQAKDDVASLEASVRVAEAQYEEAKVGITSAKRNISAAEASRRSAEASVEQARAGITTAEQLIKQRQAELANAQSEATRAKRLVEKKGRFD